MAERIVTKVKPKRKLLYFPELILQKRVAAYARVSTDSDEQLNSIAAQKDYFEIFLVILHGFYTDRLMDFT